MFFRIKNIKNKNGKIYPYAYLVDNKWYKRGNKNRGKGPRQKVVKYLGRVFLFSKENDVDFLSFLDVPNYENIIKKNNKKIIKKLIEWEFHRYDVDNKEFLVNFDEKTVNKNNKEISIKLNEGLLNSYTLKKLLGFKYKGDEREDGYRLAKLFVDTGLDVPKEVFVGIFNKGYNY